jgi:hypothetical protein
MIPRTIAHFVSRRRRLVALCAAALSAIAIVTIIFGVRFASDVLDLLPRHFDSVKAFKTFDREFSQARELTFALHDETGQCDLDGFAEFFAAELRKEPWIVRVMDRSPMEMSDSPASARDLGTIAVPLLMNLEPAEFDLALAQLAPERIGARLHELHAKLESGSPKAEGELNVDPLGVVFRALKPLAGSFSLETTRPLVSPDVTLHVVLAVTSQSELGARACQETMRRVEEFRHRVCAAWSAGPCPRVHVTGRTAYVGELSLKMRRDILSSVSSSALLVAGIFWFGFRRVRPLFAILHVLLLCCVIAVAIGALLFHELNMITIGLCSILVGLGVDFGMMLYGIYQSERDHGHDHEEAIAAALRHHGSGIIFGALTTAAAFLCLTLSECDGFAQLGVLIACGIVVAGALMMSVFFVFIGKGHRARSGDWLRDGGGRFLHLAMEKPRAIFLSTSALLVALTAYCFLPIGHIRFEADPKSLEPKNSLAGIALRLIQSKLVAAGEPVLVIVESNDAEDFHQRWNKLQSAWSALVEEGKLRSANSPAAFALSPSRLKINREKLAAAPLAAARDALGAALEREGMPRDSFAPAFALLDALAAIASGDLAPLDWRRGLPEASPVWFVIDHFLGRSPGVGVGYVVPMKKLASFEEKEALREMLSIPGVGAHISGWSYTLQDLVPWSKTKVIELTAAMIALNIALLLFLFRRAFPLVVMMTSLALSVGAMVASLKFLGVSMNLFNVLAFPLVLGVGVDYGIYVAIAVRAPDWRRELASIMKPVMLSGLTTAAGFGSLVTSQNPSLRGLGVVCAFGVGWCLFATFCFILPACIWRKKTTSDER